MSDDVRMVKRAIIPKENRSGLSDGWWFESPLDGTHYLNTKEYHEARERELDKQDIELGCLRAELAAKDKRIERLRAAIRDHKATFEREAADDICEEDRELWRALEVNDE